MLRETARLRDYVLRNDTTKGYTAEDIASMAGYEIRAEAFRIHTRQRDKGERPRGIHIAVTRVFERLARLVRAIRNGLARMGFQTAESVLDRIYGGELADRVPRRREGVFDPPDGAPQTGETESGAPTGAVSDSRDRPLGPDDGEAASLYRQPLITDTAAFRTWFGKSKVVDGQGRPLVVYHGTDRRVVDFDPSRRGSNTKAPSAREGFFFTDRKKTAEYYSRGEWGNVETARKISSQRRDHYLGLVRSFERVGNATEAARYREMADRETGPNVVAAYLSLQNPLIHDLRGRIFRDESYYDIIVRAKALGHDGVIIRNTYDAGEYSKFDAWMQGRFRPETVYVAFDPSQIRSAAAASRDRPLGPDDDAALASVARPVPGLYSAVERAVTTAKTAKASADQWLGTLRNAPGVKAEELQWLGIEDWLREQKGPVTKGALADYVRANRIEVREVEKGGPAQSYEIFLRATGVVVDRGLSRAEALRLVDERYDMRPGDGPVISRDPDGPRFARYALPGGENYRELLLTLPIDSRQFDTLPMDDIAKRLGYGGWSSSLPAAQKAHVERVFALQKLGPVEFNRRVAYL
jgi:hypothetical protein